MPYALREGMILDAVGTGALRRLPDSDYGAVQGSGR